MSKKSLFIIRGVPGSGKTELAQSLADGDAMVLSNDDYWYDKDGNYVFRPDDFKKAFEHCKSRCDAAMKAGVGKIFIANTNTKEKYMIPYREMAEKYGYTVFHLIVENRHGGVNQHNVSESTISAMEKSLRDNIVLR